MVLGATLAWSLAGLFVRHVPGLTGWQINCWRGLSMGVALMAWLAFQNRGRVIAPFREIPMPALLASAGFFALGSTLYVTALTFTSTANVSALGATAPVFTGVLAGLLMGEKAKPQAWAAAILAICGVVFIVREGLAPGDWLGTLISLGFAFSFAGQTVTLRHYRAFDMMPAVALGGFLSFGAAALFGGLNIPLEALPVLCLMGPVQLAIPLVLYAKGARSVPAITLSLIALLDIVLSPFWTWAIVGERPGSAAIIGGFIIVTAVLISLAGARPQQTHQP